MEPVPPNGGMQMPDFTQSFNRYSYCLNNPLKYTDPDGEFVWLIPALVGGAMNLAFNAKNIGNFWEGLGYFGVGALAGGLSAGIGTGIATSMSGASFWAGFVGSSQGFSAILGASFSSSFLSGAAIGAAGGFAGGFIGGTGNALMGGASFGDGLLTGLKSGGWGALTGGVIGGIGGGVIGGIGGGISAARDGRDFLTGGPTLETKLDMLADAHAGDLTEMVGEAGVEKVYLANNKNLAGTGCGNIGGDILTSDGQLANGFATPGKYYGSTLDGYAKFDNNKIYLSKNTVRGMWRGYKAGLSSIRTSQTLYHEWYHCKDFHSGWASYFNYKYGGSTKALYMLEFRAHSFNYSLNPTSSRLGLMEHYARLFLGL